MASRLEILLTEADTRIKALRDACDAIDDWCVSPLEMGPVPEDMSIELVRVIQGLQAFLATYDLDFAQAKQDSHNPLIYLDRFRALGAELEHLGQIPEFAARHLERRCDLEEKIAWRQQQIDSLPAALAIWTPERREVFRGEIARMLERRSSFTGRWTILAKEIPLFNAEPFNTLRAEVNEARREDSRQDKALYGAARSERQRAEYERLSQGRAERCAEILERWGYHPSTAEDGSGSAQEPSEDRPA